MNNFYDEDTNEYICSKEKIEIICPPDYDGAVFGIINSSSENREVFSSLFLADISKGGITIGTGTDVSQILQSECVFFSLTDK